MIENTNNPTSKPCTKCGKIKLLTSEFWYRDKNKYDGFSCQCKQCSQEEDLARDKKKNPQYYADLEEAQKLLIEHKKKCSICNDIKDLDDFYYKKGNLGDRSGSCRICSSEVDKTSLHNKNLKLIEEENCKVCERCECKKPLTEEFWNTQNSPISKFRSKCKICEKELKDELLESRKDLFDYSDKDYVKPCNRCGKEKNAESNFNKSVQSVDGYRCICKLCISEEICNEHFERNKEDDELYKNGEKRCSNCKIVKSIKGNFGKSVKGKNGLGSLCNICISERTAAKTYAKYKNPLNDSPFTLEDYDLLFEEQNCKCAICSRDLDYNSEKNNWPCLDHNHETMYVRGILCHFCNILLGLSKDNISILTNAINYLKNTK